MELDKVKQLVRSCLPQADDTIVEDIAKDIIRDAEKEACLLKKVVAPVKATVYKKASRK